MVALAPIYIEAPAVAPAKYNLLDTVPVLNGTSRALLGVQYESEFCGVANTFTDPCEAPGTKTPNDGITTVTGDPITVYHLFQCRAPGAWDRARERARRSLELGASRAVEAGLQTIIGTGATDITPGGTAVSLIAGLALAEDYAGDNYGGRPVMHMSRGIAIRLFQLGAIIQKDDHLETGLGSLVVAGAGYDASASLPSAPAAGAGWIYVTGQVNIWAGDVIAQEPVLKSPYDNEFQALAEQVFVPTYECFKAAVEVTLP